MSVLPARHLCAIFDVHLIDTSERRFSNGCVGRVVGEQKPVAGKTRRISCDFDLVKGPKNDPAKSVEDTRSTVIAEIDLKRHSNDRRCPSCLSCKCDCEDGLMEQISESASRLFSPCACQGPDEMNSIRHGSERLFHRMIYWYSAWRAASFPASYGMDGKTGL